MSLGEFELIDRYFRQTQPRPGVVVGIGDDAAVVDVPTDRQLAVTADTLVAGVHFPASTDPGDVGYKSLAVNLSDLGAMGAVPRWYLLSLTMPEADESWLTDFTEGLRALESIEGVALIGGDTTRGPLAISIQAMGLARRGAAVLRAGAEVGDDVYVTGTLGDAALGLKFITGELPQTAFDDEAVARSIARLARPRPRTVAGYSLAPFLHAMIDCSDGFVADLGHILHASGCGAEIELAKLPLSAPVRRLVETEGWALPLSGGDDYELILTAAPSQRSVINDIADVLPCSLTRVGRIVDAHGIRLIDADGTVIAGELHGYTHFESRACQPS